MGNKLSADKGGGSDGIASPSAWGWWCFSLFFVKISAKKNAVDKEQVVKLVDDTYRKLQVTGTTDTASKGHGASDSSNVKVKREVADSFQSDTKCEDTKCPVSQHINCVIIPDKPIEDLPPLPDKFYCEICRLSRADPFSVSMTHPLFPVKLITTHIPTDGTNPVQSVEKTFQLTRATKDLLLKQDFEIQAWCMLLNDKVPFRMQWPQYADLLVNGYSVRAINRPGSQLLGANGRDDGPIVLNLIPKESDGERFEAALARVCCRVGGGNSANEADSDSDLEVVSDTFSINLRCPMSGSRMKIAGRFKPCVHMGCFDLEVFVEMNQRSRKWQCPICLKNYALENIIIDPYFNRITSMMKNCGEEFTEVEVKPDGYWRVKAKNESECRELGNLAKWHSPDGSLSVSTSGEDKRAETLNVKQEGVSDSPNRLRLGIRKNCNGVWEVSKPIETNTSSDNRLNANLGNHELVVIQMSSSGTGSGLDGDDPSVNQSGGGHIDYSATNGIETDSVRHTNVNSTYGYTIPSTSAPMADADIIVLSDSEDDDILVSPIVGRNNNQTGDAVDVYSAPPPGITDPYAGDHNIDGNPCLGVYDNPGVCFGVPSVWPLHSGTQASSGFQLFSSDVDVSDALVHGDINCSSSLNSYSLAPDTVLGSNTLIPTTDQSDTDLNGGLVDNPLAFGGNDPSLQIFLPTRPAESSVRHELRDHTDVSNGVCTEDWISLSLGGGAVGSNGDASTPNGLNSVPQTTSRKDATDSLTNTASLLLGMNDAGSDKASKKRSEGPFSFPRQKRSVRQRLHLSIDSDSE
ncbi:hypothetical protein TSUD_108790 [Trifolium subterraneum]|nr:hypothetical protein TSUD_108790 [Trifolium subterraneum]